MQIYLSLPFSSFIDEFAAICADYLPVSPFLKGRKKTKKPSGAFFFCMANENCTLSDDC